jgi:hypothetical protein
LPRCRWWGGYRRTCRPAECGGQGQGLCGSRERVGCAVMRFVRLLYQPKERDEGGSATCPRDRYLDASSRHSPCAPTPETLNVDAYARRPVSTDYVPHPSQPQAHTRVYVKCIYTSHPCRRIYIQRKRRKPNHHQAKRNPASQACRAFRTRRLHLCASKRPRSALIHIYNQSITTPPPARVQRLGRYRLPVSCCPHRCACKRPSQLTAHPQTPSSGRGRHE